MAGRKVDLPALLAGLEEGGALTETSLTLTDSEMPFERWEAMCSMMGRLRSANCWWIGDLLNFGEGVYGERYAQGMETFGLDYSTLVGYAYVSRNVPRGRRRATLTFSHHREVAPLTPDEQTQWLANAAEMGWSSKELRERVRAIGTGHDPTPPDPAPGGGITVEQAARRVLAEAQERGDVFEVPVEPMRILAASLGADE